MKRSIRLIVCLALRLANQMFGAVNVQQQPNGDFYTPVLEWGSSAQKYDIVFIGDGFTVAEQQKFNENVGKAVNALKSLSPYGERKMCWANIWRVNVISAQSGVDHPKDGIFKNTELNCTYGNPNGNPPTPERLITSLTPGKCYEAADYAPDYDAVFVLVNDPQWGGAAGSLVFSSIHPGDTQHPGGFAGIITHELGHKIGKLADEYWYYLGKDIDGNETYFGPEPSATNLTLQTNPGLIKWGDLILPNTPLPTTVNQPYGVVGLWEGGGYHRYGIYRPQTNCQMREVESPFCKVCEREMRSLLHSRCADCDEEPFHPECFFLDPFKKLFFATRFKCKWPLPICPFCPELELGTEIIYILEGSPAGSFLQIQDEEGKVVTQSLASGKRQMVSFRALASKQYYVEVTSGAVPASGVELNSILIQNGIEQQLPE